MVERRFVKKTYGGISGKQKAAMLFSSLGFDASSDVMKYLSTEELRKIRMQMKGLGSWVDMSAENTVLEDCLKFGMMRGYVPRDAIAVAEENARILAEQAQRRGALGGIDINSNDIAKVLSIWMKE